MADNQEEFDPTPFLKLIEKFTVPELKLVLKDNACSGHSKSNKAKASMAVQRVLRSERGKAASITVTEIQKTKCPIDPSNKEEFQKMAQEVTDAFNLDEIKSSYDKEGRILAPIRDSKYLFDKAFLAACNGKLDLFSSQKGYSNGWEFIGEEGKGKWKNGFKKLTTQYDTYLHAGLDAGIRKKKELNSAAPIKVKSDCSICSFHSTNTHNTERHIEGIHFPDHKSSVEVERRLQTFLEAARSDSNFAEKFRNEVLAFNASLYTEKQSEEESKLIQEMFEKLLLGQKESVVYILAQLRKGFELLSDSDLFTLIARYVGKLTHMDKEVRHFESTGNATGNIKLAIKKIVQEHLTKKNVVIEDEERLYAWHGIVCSASNVGTLEHCITLAQFVLTGRNETFWNLKLEPVAVGESLRNHDPKELAFLGCFIRRELVISFRQKIRNGSFYRSKELLNIYDAFTPEQRNSFNQRYSISKSTSDQVAALTDILAEIRIVAEQEGNGKILKLCDKADEVLEPKSDQTEQMSGTSDVD